jgi:hypothetical protein
MKKRKKRFADKDRHHIIPKSRKRVKSKDNIVFIDKIKHSDYHRLFHNRTPVEIIDYLVNYFWGGKEEFLIQYLERR